MTITKNYIKIIEQKYKFNTMTNMMILLIIKRDPCFKITKNKGNHLKIAVELSLINKWKNYI